ncbi:hypothetical protein ANCCAN_08660 [Ancylostoma caninum]|uniref:Nucleotide-diphospho-sugar transferase domain-containing protein n=1 Tax=Ancylostoma caninum TaxID=29170 RepID=A0A368GPZ6_ANCCA|nr:hypothetical protein ANCCAN_08660 [Ancylostoma caninum]
MFRKKMHMFLLAFLVVFTLYAVSSTTHPLLVQERFIDNECFCQYKNISYDFCYHLPQTRSIKGRRFSCEHASHLERLGLLSNKNFIDASKEELPTPAFVTAMSDNHYQEGLTLIANIRSHWPRQKIIVYNLGLSAETIAGLTSKCMVEVREFPFDKYPPYVKVLTEYRWKPLLIAMALREFGAIWYMDTSVRWKKDRREVVYREITCRKMNGLRFFR